MGCVFVSWGCGHPTTKSDFRHFKGDQVIVIGEPEGGCTSDGCLDKLDKNPAWELITIIDIPKWYGMHDRLVVYERS